MPKLANEQGQAVYFNGVEKGGKVRWVVLAASGQTLQKSEAKRS